MTGMTATMQASRDAMGVLRRFLRWWGGELKFLMSYPPLDKLFGGADRVIVDVDSDRVWITKCHAGQDTELGSFALAGGLSQEAQAELRRLVRRGTEAVIRLPREQILCRDITLPLAAEPNLHEVLGFEMDRQTPFRASQVYYDHHVVERQGDEGRLKVQMMVVPQAALAPMVQTLEGLGLVPSMITVSEEGASQCQVATINLLPESMRKRPPGAWGGVNRALLASAAVLAVAAAAMPLQRQFQVISELEGRIEALRPDVAATQARRASIDSMREELGLFLEQKQQSPVIIDVVEEVSRLLPDDTWLVRLELQGRKLHLQGIAGEAPALISLLEGSPMFANVAFSSPVVRDPRFNRFQFNIDADVVGGRAG
ncbi:MAG: PilN domain-containing protein [Pseudomonadota bacterium]